MKKYKLIFKIIVWTLIIFLVYLATFALIPPAIHPKGNSKSNKENILQSDYSGERVLCINDNKEALFRRLQMISSAKKEIILSTFDFHIDQSGKRILAALYAAADRGVNVKLLIDGVSMRLNLQNNNMFRTFMMHKNTEVKAYSKINAFAPWKWNYRLHDKYLIADNIYMIGGRNTYDLFLGDYKKHKNIDRDILVYSKAIDNKKSSLMLLHDYFEKMWKSDNCSTIYKKTTLKEENQKKLLEINKNLFDEFPKLCRNPDWKSLTFPSSNITILVNPKKDFVTDPTLWNNLCAYMKKGKNILIQTPYIIFNKKMYKDFTDICNNCESVNIMTNAVESGANPFGCTDYLTQKEKIISCGTGVYEYLGVSSMHTKTVLIDDDISIIGSFNMDERSAYLDTEMMIVVEGCSELNKSLRQEYQEMESKSLHVMPNGDEIPGENYIPRALIGRKKRFYTFLKYFMHPFRYLL